MGRRARVARGQADDRYDGAVAVVTGASSGIGRGLASELAARGARVHGVARSAGSLGGLAGVTAHACDLEDVDRFVALLREVEVAEGRIDILANVAAESEPAGVSTDVGVFRRTMDVNFWAPAIGTLHVLAGMSDRGRGIIVNISSDSVRTPIPGEAAYVASKGALGAFSDSVALDALPPGVRVHVVYPGFVRTRMGSAALARGMPPPPAMVERTVEEVVRRILERAGGRRIEIDLVPVAALSPVFRFLFPVTYQRTMRRRGMPTAVVAP